MNGSSVGVLPLVLQTSKHRHPPSSRLHNKQLLSVLCLQAAEGQGSHVSAAAQLPAGATNEDLLVPCIDVWNRPEQSVCS